MFTKVSITLYIRIVHLLMHTLQLGVNWASTLLGIIGIVLTPSPFLFYKFGARIRAGSTFAPGIVSLIASVFSSTCSDALHPFEGPSHSEGARVRKTARHCISVDIQ
jgi:hypothetical protein